MRSSAISSASFAVKFCRPIEFSSPYPETLTGVTPLAVLEIEIAEGSPAIMTSCAGVVPVGEVFQGARRAHLSLLWQPGGVAVTIGATQTLGRAVFGVTESKAKRGGVC